ncbi:hypothetical protein B0J17DRAFT_625793 [Rhizoctonia solani]|nr:hypothetical protein B0J17DRAFT_625793 [Rhizoctonia solani]
MGYSFGVLENKKAEYLKAPLQVFPLINALWYMTDVYQKKRRSLVNGTLDLDITAGLDIISIMRCAPTLWAPKVRIVHIPESAPFMWTFGKIRRLILQSDHFDSPQNASREQKLVFTCGFLAKSAPRCYTTLLIDARYSALVSADHDITSGNLVRTFYPIAQHPDVQDRVRKEIKGVYRLGSPAQMVNVLRV